MPSRTVHFVDDTYTDLVKLSKSNGVTLSALVNEVITEWCDKQLSSNSIKSENDRNSR